MSKFKIKFKLKFLQKCKHKSCSAAFLVREQGYPYRFLHRGGDWRGIRDNLEVSQLRKNMY